MDVENRKIEMINDESPERQSQDRFDKCDSTTTLDLEKNTNLRGATPGPSPPSQQLGEQQLQQQDVNNPNDVVISVARVYPPPPPAANIIQVPQAGIELEPLAAVSQNASPADQNAAAAAAPPPPAAQILSSLSDRIRQAEQEVQAAENDMTEQELYFQQRRRELDTRVDQVKEENVRNAFIWFFLFWCFFSFTVADYENLAIIYRDYPEAAIFLVGSVVLFGVEFIIQISHCNKFSVECNKKCCPLTWTYIILSLTWNSWGAAVVLSDRYEAVFTKNKERDMSMIHNLVPSIMWVRLIGTAVYAILIYCMGVCFLRWKFSSDSADRQENKRQFENVLVYVFESRHKYQRRAFNEKLDSDITCSICLGPLSDTPADRELAQLDCNSKHIFHNSCLQGWLGKQPFCPLCRQVIPIEE